MIFITASIYFADGSVLRVEEGTTIVSISTIKKESQSGFSFSSLPVENENGHLIPSILDAIRNAQFFALNDAKNPLYSVLTIVRIEE